MQVKTQTSAIQSLKSPDIVNPSGPHSTPSPAKKKIKTQKNTEKISIQETSKPPNSTSNFKNRIGIAFDLPPCASEAAKP